MFIRNQVPTMIVKNSLSKCRLITLCAFASFGVMTHSAIAEEKFEKVLEKGIERVKIAQNSQDKIDSVDDNTRVLEREYRDLSKEIEGLKVYVKQLDKQLDDQKDELSTLEESIESVTLVERQITPLMLKMIDAIDQFVEKDMPFKKDVRQQRVTKLKKLIGRADVSVAEKYRNVAEVYQIEMNYGRSIEAYRAPLNAQDTQKEVDYLRVGRIALMYITLDGSDMGVWNGDKQTWQPLSPEYKSKLQAGIRIAREQTAPSLILTPVPSAKPVTTSSMRANG